MSSSFVLLGIEVVEVEKGSSHIQQTDRVASSSVFVIEKLRRPPLSRGGRWMPVFKAMPVILLVEGRPTGVVTFLPKIALFLPHGPNVADKEAVCQILESISTTSCIDWCWWCCNGGFANPSCSSPATVRSYLS